ncbi:MAG TPA: hypothetical protein PLF13_14435, partial [candidate division Zixibacteria bacterium]|nr:hypothetical protein [candidate division Zixibacteria bacterium]
MVDQTNRMQASMAHLLGEASKNLARFLEKVLPDLFEDWWNELIREEIPEKVAADKAYQNAMR